MEQQLSLDMVRVTEAAAIALERDVVIADTKFEFGQDADGRIRIADEVLTSDSSRYWDARADGRTDSFDKQIVRDWLSANWDRQGTPPVLPEAIVSRTAARYAELIERLGALRARRHADFVALWRELEREAFAARLRAAAAERA